MDDSEKQTKFDSLNKEYETYISKLKAEWHRNNKPPQSRDVYEVMNREDREKVAWYIREWSIYITPFAEAWWKERGYGVIWPDDDSKPMKVYELENA